MSKTAIRPVFIVGPGRSGSTLLYKVMSLHPEIGFISNYDAGCYRLPFVAGVAERLFSSASEKLNSWFDNLGGAYYLKRPIRKRLVPTPVEGEPLFARCQLVKGAEHQSSDRIATCLKEMVGRLQARKGTPVLLIKRTALNKSIPLLYKTFPEARFVFLVRDGRAVVSSLLKVEWWAGSPLPWADWKTPGELQARGDDMTWIAARTWVAGVEYAQDGLAGVPDSQVFRLRYEDFLAAPKETLAQILDFLAIDSDASFDDAVDKLALSPRPESWPRQLSPEQQQTVLQTQGPLLVDYGYL